jgi:mono/diheme cytochrome c family protein
VRSRSALAFISLVTIGVAYAGHIAVAAQADPPGKAPYEENCRKCHGVRGVAPKTMQAKFPKIATFNEAFFDKHTPDSIVVILTKGKGQDMKSFKDKLSTAQMVAVATYIRTFPAK